MKTQLIVYETDPLGNTSVMDLVELGDKETRKRTRTRVMREFGRLLDQMLDKNWGCDRITVERMD